MRTVILCLLLSPLLTSCLEGPPPLLPVYPQDMPHLPGLTQPGLHWAAHPEEWSFADTLLAADTLDTLRINRTFSFFPGEAISGAVPNEWLGVTAYALGDSLDTTIEILMSRYGTALDAFWFQMQVVTVNGEILYGSAGLGSYPIRRVWTTATGTVYEGAMLLGNLRQGDPYQVVYMPKLGVVEILWPKGKRLEVRY